MVDRQWTRALFGTYSQKERKEEEGKKGRKKAPKNLRASKQKLSHWDAVFLHPVSMVLRNCEFEKESLDWRAEHIALRKDPAL